VQHAFSTLPADWPAGLRVRPITESDHLFLCDLYASVRAAELAPVPWPADAKRQFLDQQFALQHQHYVNVYIGAKLLLIEQDGVPIGRIYIHRTPAEIRLMDIALIAERRGKGLGSLLLRELMHEARANACELTLHVEPENPAQRLYRRHGFYLIEHRGVYDFLGWKSGG
jgi:ribosomal protein S18 acetylase RimI-like enzyme